MFMRTIYDEKLAQAAYLFGCQRSGEAIIIDPERDVDRYIDLAAAHGLTIVATAETHIHADFLSGSRELAERVGATVYVSDEGDADWKYQWLDAGAYKHVLLKHGNTFRIGAIEFRVIHTPGHTPEHIAFLVADRGSGANEPIGIVTGDFVFVGDLGRPDLLESAAGQQGAMEPAARRLYQSVRTLDALPEFVQVWPGHGAGSACGKALGAVPSSTIGYEQRFNPAIRAASDESGFVKFILSGQPEPPVYFAAMKRDNKQGPRVLGSLPSPERLAQNQLMATNTRETALIDTRPWQAFQIGHVPGALSIPLNSAFTTNAGSIVRDDEPIALIVEPDRLEEAIRDLVRIGLDRIVGWVDASDLEAFAHRGGLLSQVPEVQASETDAVLEDAHTLALDVRRATEFAEGHLPNAINIAHTRLAMRLNELSRDHRLLVYCRSGARSGVAASFLMRNGFEVINVRGGYLAWEQVHEPELRR